MYGDIGESALSAESTRKAYQLRDRASDPEKFFITASYDLQVTGNLEKAQQTCELWAQTYPREANPHGFLAAMIYPVFGKYEKAVEEARKLVELDPDFPIAYYHLAFNYAYLDRLEEAENALQRAAERKLEIPELSIQRYDIAFLKGDRAGMEREAALGRGNPALEDWISQHEAFVLAYSGHLQQARRCRGAPRIWPADSPTGNSGSVRNRSSAAGSLLRECARGQRRRDGSTRAFQEPRCGVWRCVRAGPLRRFLPGSSARE